LSPPYPWLRAHGSPWSQGPAERVHDNAWFAVDRYDAIAPTGAKAKYHVHDQKAWATGVVPLHEHGTITLVGQWRFPFGAYSWEVPEGGVPKDEDILAGIQRELAEEAGLQARHWRHVLRMQLSNSSSNEVAYGFIAWDLSPTDAHHADDTEDLARARVPFREALGAVIAGHIVDAITVALLLRIHHMAVTGELDTALAKAVLE